VGAQRGARSWEGRGIPLSGRVAGSLSAREWLDHGKSSIVPIKKVSEIYERGPQKVGVLQHRAVVGGLRCGCEAVS